MVLMLVQLTAEEQRDLLWEPGDHFEVLSGNISFTSRRQFRRVASEHSPMITEVQFFFESATKKWGTQEWTMCMEADIPNGPALLVVYRRGSEACAWGVISMVNRAWSHCLPLDSLDFAKGSSKLRKLSSAQNGSLFKMVGLALAGIILTCGVGMLLVPVIMVVPATRDWLMKTSGFSKSTQSIEQLGARARGLMFRLSQNANQLWEGQSGAALSGRL